MQPNSSSNKEYISWVQRILLLCAIMSLLTSCSLPTLPSAIPQTPTPIPSPTPIPQQTNITFHLTLSQPLLTGESVYLTVLDEVSGLAFNPLDYVMTAEDATIYTSTIPFQVGAVIKYRYTRHGTSNVSEHLSNGEPVRYRLYHVEGPGVVQDTLSCWTDTQFTGNIGRVAGQIKDNSSGQPIPNILVTAGGAQAFTKADGSYLIEGLPEGVHNLVAYALDGTYNTYQQGAEIAKNSTTPASINLSYADTVMVVFSVTVPEITPSEAPLRLAGNLYQLGNTFADLSGGVSLIASRMPLLNKLPDGRYAVALNLPVGAYIEYKYTLGDGLWNAEHSFQGSLMTRHFLVPNTDIQVNDTVSNWGIQQGAPIQFDITVPSYTQVNEGVSIQFNPGFGWLEPLPTWSTMNSQGQPIHRFILLSPLEILGTIQYRICRADQCGIADDRSTSGANPLGNMVNPGALPQIIIYRVSDWNWYQSISQQASIPNVAINQHGLDFLAGISFDQSYHPSWGTHVNDGIDMVNNLGANWLIIRPTWSFSHTQSPMLAILPSQDILLPELTSYITRADNLGINVGLYPTPNFPVSTNQWWAESPRDFSWWIVWFENYTQFILHHVDIANQNNVEAVIIGGDWINPALPDGTLRDGTSSGVPADADYRWRSLIAQIRQRYQGSLIWALSYPESVQDPPSFINQFDRIIVEWSASLSDAKNPSVTDLHHAASRILDQEILPFSQSIGKPIIIAVEYPSADGSSTGCISIGDSCIPAGSLSTSYPDLSEADEDLQEQADLYNAIFLAVNERDWLTGVISMGFFPPVALHDPSLSVYGKPAAGVLWYWYPRLLGDQP